MRIAPKVLSTALFALALFGFTAPVTHAEPDLPPGRTHEFKAGEGQEAHRIQRVYQETGREIGETHAKALRREELAEPLEELRNTMLAEMIRLEPELEETIRRRYAIHRQMTKLGKIEQPTEEQKERFQELSLEYSNTTEAIGNLPERAGETPAVRKAAEKFRKKLLRVMTEINPRIPDLMEKQKQAVVDYRTLEEELLRRHGGEPMHSVPPAPR